jgi:predicted nucleic acid-binding protein
VIVIDASALVEFLLRSITGVTVGTRIFADDDSLHAPHLLDVEVAHAVRKFVARGVVAPERGATALQLLTDLSIVRYSHLGLLRRIWLLRDNVSAYDATYVALAESLDVPLLTCDQRLAGASNHKAKIEFFPIRAH